MIEFISPEKLEHILRSCRGITVLLYLEEHEKKEEILASLEALTNSTEEQVAVYGINQKYKKYMHNKYKIIGSPTVFVFESELLKKEIMGKIDKEFLKNL